MSHPSQCFIIRQLIGEFCLHAIQI